MGYRAEKLKIEKRIKILKRVLLGILLLCIVGLCIFAALVPPSSWKYHVGKPDVPERKDGELRIHFIDVGQGDATLLELPDGKTMLIDGGDGSEDATKSLLRYLNALDIDELDYLVVTHAGSDHCGGLDTLLEYFDVLVAYLPPSLPSTNGEYAEFYAAMLKTDCDWSYASRGIENITSDDARYPYTISFLYPYEDDVEFIVGMEKELDGKEQNEFSSVIWLDYNGTSALFTGDAPFVTEEKLMKDSEAGYFTARGVNLKSTEILKVAHHGSSNSTSKEFLEYLGVKAAVISCGATNGYGHPSPALLSRLDLAGAKTYRTDVSSHIMATLFQKGKFTIENVK